MVRELKLIRYADNEYSNLNSNVVDGLNTSCTRAPDMKNQILGTNIL